MATIKELIAGIEVEREAAEKREQKARKEIEVILASAQQEGRSALSEEEDARCEELFNMIELAKTQQAGITQKLSRAKKVEAEETEAEARLDQVRRTNAGATNRKPAYDEVMRVGREERVYNPESDRTGKQFLSDVSRQFLYGDVGAQSRLARHMQEERVERGPYLQRAAGDTTTTNWAGLTVPQYLVDMVAPAVANLRPFADAATNKHTLPADGMSVNISQVTTATAASLQATQLTTVTAASADDTLLTIPVQTAAGFQNISRQAIDRGTGIEDVLLQDLFARYNTDLDNQLINQASTGLLAVAAGNTWTQGSPTGAQLYSQITKAASGVEGALLAMGQPTHVVMHSRRWYWFSSQTSTAWPMLNFQSPSQTMNNNAFGYAYNNAYNQGPRGVLPNGLAVVVDNNIPTNLGAGTNEDRVAVVSQRECHLWEDPNQPAYIRAEQPNAPQLGVLLVVYGYYAYTFSRYANAVQSLSGTGLVTPVFPG
jgi:hypothetical protein